MLSCKKMTIFYYKFLCLFFGGGGYIDQVRFVDIVYYGMVASLKMVFI